MLSGEFYPQLKKVIDESKRKKRNFWSLIFFVILGTLFFSLLNFDSPILTKPSIKPKILGIATSDTQNPTFSQNIKPVFVVDSGSPLTTQDKIKTTITRNSEVTDLATEIKTVPNQKGQFEITVTPESQFKPGKYQLIINFDTPTKDQTLTQDFYWGVLAVNLRRSIEKPNTKTEIGLAVLDDAGLTQCDALVVLDIISPTGEKQVFQTTDQSIEIIPSCADKTVTNNPDYSAFYTTQGVGTYTMKVTATIANGTRSATDTFEIKDNVPFDIERTAFPTRIYPKDPYPVAFTVMANENYRGKVIETVPSSFGIDNISGNGAEIKPNNQSTQIAWQVDWKKGETYELSYTIDFPKVSPEFYLLGPLKIGDFNEARQWQIASDATFACAPVAPGTGGAKNWNTAALWTNCNGGYPGQNDPAANVYNVSITETVAVTWTLSASPTYAISSLAITGNGVGHTVALAGFNLTTTTVNGATGAVTLTVPTSNTITNQVTTTSGTFDAAGLITLGGAATNRICLITTATGSIKAKAGVTLTNNAASRLTVTGAGHFYLTGTYAAAASANGTLAATSTFHSVGAATVNKTLTFGHVTLDAGSSLAIGIAQTVAGNWTNSSGTGALTGAFTVTKSTAGDTIGGTYATTFNALTLAASSTTTANTSFTVTNALTFTATAAAAQSLTLGSGSVIATLNTVAHTQPSGAFTSAFNINAGTANVAGTYTLTATSATANLINRIKITTGTLNLNAATSLTFGATAAATLHIVDTSGGAAKVYVAGAISNAANATSIPGTTSTWIFDGTAAGQSIPMTSWGSAAAYANIQILNTNAAGAYPTEAISATEVTGNITVGDDVGTAAIMKNGSVNIADNSTSSFIVKNAATFQMDGTTAVFPTSYSTFTFGATSTTIYKQTSAQNIYNVATPGYGNLTMTPAGVVSYSGTAGSLLVQGNLVVGNGANALTFTNTANDPIIDINGNVTIAATAIFIASDLNDMTVGGNWSNSSTFTHSSRKVTFDGTGGAAISGSTTFNNLVMNTTTDGAKTITFPIGVGNKQTIAGTWTLDGAVGKVLTLVSATPTSAWYFQITAPLTAGDYINVTDSWNADTNKITPGANTTDGGNNDGWIFAAPNADPTNNSLTFTNPYSSNIAISDDTTSWNFRALVTDTDGPTDIDYAEIHFANSADSAQPYDSLKFRWTEATDTFSETADTQTAATLTSTSADSNFSVNTWTLNFKIKINNSFLAKDTNYAAELYTLDDAAAADTDNYVNKYQVATLFISINVDSPTIIFGPLLPGTVITDTTVTTVTTNYPNGYTLGAHDSVTGANSALRHTDTTTRIADYVGTIAAPTVWPTPGETGLGICVYIATGKNTTQWGGGTTEGDALNKYAGAPQTVTTIHAKTGSPTAGDTTSIGYKLVAPNTQKTGDYSGDITYTATGVLL